MPWLFVALFLIGACTSILLQCWCRAFIPYLGGSLISTSLVVAAFLGSAAVGSWIAAHSSIMIRRPRLTVAIDLCALGILGVLSLWLLELTTPLHSWVYSWASENFWMSRWSRVAVVALQIALPGIAVGISLTGVTRLAPGRDHSHSAVKTSLMYSALLFGILVGAILAGYVLLPGFGLTLSAVVAGVGLILVAFGFGWSQFKENAASGNPAEAPTAESAPSRIDLQALEVCSLVGGIASFGILVAWFRLLSSIFGATTYALTAVTSVFLLGSGLGSLAASRLVHHTRYSSLEGLYLYGMAGLLSLIASAFVNELPVWYGQLYWSLSFGNPSAAYIAAQMIVASVVLLPSSFAFGSVLPYLIKVQSSHLNSQSHSPRVVGRMVAHYLAGCVLGLVIAGTYLLQKLGSAKTILLFATLMILGSFYLAFRLPKIGVSRRFKAIAILSTLALVSAITLPQHNPLLTSHGLFTKMKGYKDIFAFIEDRDAPISRLLFFEEGLHGSVAVVANQENLGRLALRVNGHLLAGSGAAQRRHLTLLSYLPFIFNSSAREVLVLGLGTGITSGQILTIKAVQQVTVVEPEPAMVRASQWFRFINQAPLRDARLKVIREDPRVHLKFSKQSYDIITSDPSDSFVGGNGTLYTREFYRDVRQRLNANGVFAQWLQGRGISRNTYRSVLRAFSESFENSHVFIDGEHTVLIGTTGPQLLSFERVADLFRDPVGREILTRDDFPTPEALLSLYFANTSGLNKLNLTSAIANSDDNLISESSIPLDLLANSDQLFSEELALDLSAGRLQSLTETFAEIPLLGVLENMITRVSPLFSESHEKIYAELRLSLPKVNLVVDKPSLQSWFERRLTPQSMATVQANAHQEILKAAKEQRPDELIRQLKVAFDDRNSTIYYSSGVLLGETLLQKARFAEALAVAEAMKSEFPAYGSAYHIAAEALIQMNQLTRARAVLEEGLFYHPSHQGLTKLYTAILSLPFSRDGVPSDR